MAEPLGKTKIRKNVLHNSRYKLIKYIQRAISRHIGQDSTDGKLF